MSEGRDEQSTGVPLFRTWGAVYAVVLGVFVVCVALLTWFTLHYTRVAP